MHATGIGIVDDDGVSALELAIPFGAHRSHRFRNGAEMLRNSLCLRHHLALGVANCRRKVHDILDDLRARGTDHRVGDFIDDGVHRIFDDGKRNRIVKQGRGVRHRTPPFRWRCSRSRPRLRCNAVERRSSCRNFRRSRVRRSALCPRPRARQVAPACAQRRG